MSEGFLTDYHTVYSGMALRNMVIVFLCEVRIISLSTEHTENTE